MLPSELLAIAAKSVIRPGLLKNTKIYGRPELLALVKADESGLTPQGNNSDVFYVKQAGPSDDGFLSYVCDYKEGEINYQVLAKEAQFCFTTTVNGCTFSLGMPAPDGTLIVSHTNMKSEKMDDADRAARGTASQSDFQAQVAAQFHGEGAMIDPTVYWGEGGNNVGGNKINVTVFGVNDSGWKFYYQRWTRESGSRVNSLLDLKTFESNSKGF